MLPQQPRDTQSHMLVAAAHPAGEGRRAAIDAVCVLSPYFTANWEVKKGKQT
jgi:hypothetical protein